MTNSLVTIAAAVAGLVVVAVSAPGFVDKLQDTPDHVVIAQFPKGWVGAWHENPAAQWIIQLSRRWFVETMDGQIEMRSK